MSRPLEKVFPFSRLIKSALRRIRSHFTLLITGQAGLSAT